MIIECIYKARKNKNSSIITRSKNSQLEYKNIDFSAEYDIIKANITINNIKEDEIQLKVKEEEKIFDTIIVDNKNEKISSDNNKYVIFLKNFKLEVLQDKIKIDKRNKFDKIIYEINKQIYSIKKYKKLALIRIFARKRKQFYLFNDRIMYADDNAEQLFKYININEENMAHKSYFVLDKKSSKIKQVRKYGKVLKYGSLRHKIKYLNCKMVISSHASYFDRVYNPFDENEMEIVRDLITKKFVFLQHGVIINDVHEILNRPQIIADLFITTTNFEYNEVSKENYMYNKEMIVCTGISRFDKLENLNKNIILIAPTWRPYLTDVKYGDSNKEQFKQSEFYTEYKSVLSDTKLLSLLKEQGFKIKFLLHPVFIQFKKEFEEFNNQFVEILTTDDNISYSELFKECSIFITDYSGTHFDVAYLKKAMIYYQFDKEKFYKSYDKGYFDYEKDGFGDVSYEKEELLEEIFNYIHNNCKIKDKYNNRINNTFKYLDKENSKRIYEEIKRIDVDTEFNYRFNKIH